MFTLAYLYKQGLSLPLAFTVYAGMLFVRTLTRPAAMYFCLKKGVHFTLMLGTAVFACRYPAMLPIDGLTWHLIPFMLISGLADVLYWVPYHNYFASIGETKTEAPVSAYATRLRRSSRSSAPPSAAFCCPLTRFTLS